MYGLLHPAVALQEEPEFRDAPDDWTPDVARAFAAGANLTLTEDHWEVIRVLQGCYKDEVSPRLRLLRDALEARFPALQGTIRDHGTLKRRPFIRFFACKEDLSQEPPETPLPAPILEGAEPFMIVGAMAGG